MRFEFATATRILFGNGTVKDIAAAAQEMGRRALIVTGSSAKRSRLVPDLLKSAGIPQDLFPVGKEPDTLLVHEGRELARRTGCDMVIAVGGGSVLDAGKAIAALMTNDGAPLDYLEVVGRGRPVARPPAPFIAIPTTAGTGSEVTRNAVLTSHEARAKASMRSPLMLPRLAIVDPELTYELPPAITAGTGLDALTQLIEPYVSLRHTPMTDALCLEGIRLVSRSLRRACLDGKDAAAREEMALASLFGGLALANAGLGVVHGFAAAIGGRYGAPHGATCAILLAPGMEANIRALRERAPESNHLERYQKVAAALTGDFAAAPEDGSALVRRWCAELSIPPLRSYGIAPEEIDIIVTKSSATSSMKGNPIPLTPEELATVVLRAFE
jgi:alcohol dehydrogenase class IV